MAVATVGERMYAFGREGNPDPAAGNVFSETEVYDVRRDRWERLGPMDTPRHGLAAVAVEGVIYMLAGGVCGFGFVDSMGVFHPGGTDEIL